MFLRLSPHHYFKRDHHFYICSFGGCGSWMLAQYLSNFGTVHHVHSRKPPPFVTTVVEERFSTVRTPYKHNTVIYIYRDPVAAMLSVDRRFDFATHLKNIECADTSVTLEALETSRKDLLGLAEFDANYTTRNQRNYDVVCVKYEDLFKSWSHLNHALHVYDSPRLYPKEKQTHTTRDTEGLKEAFSDLRGRIAKRPAVMVL